MAGLAVGGLGSGLDVNGLVQALVQAEAAGPSLRFDRREAGIQSELSGLGFLKTAGSDLRTAIATLTNLSDFSTTSVTSSETSVVTVTSKSDASPSTYSMEVQRLATSQKLATGTFTNKSDIIGTGELTFEFGTASGPFVLNTDKTSKTVDLSQTDGSLTAIRDAVNQAEIGVSATIINEGSGYKLNFTASDTGAANSLRISVDDDDLSDTNMSGLSQLAYDPDGVVGSGKNMTESVTALDSQFVLDGTTINTASNVLTDTIEGLTITLKKEDTGNTHTITVSQGTNVGQSEVESFITAYNTFNVTLRTLSSYDADTGEVGILFGDSTLRDMMTFASSLIASPVSELNSDYNTLASIGISSSASDGSISLDSDIFNAATDAEPDIVARLFSNFGKTTDSNIDFVSASSTAAAGSHIINIDSLATQGTAVGGAAANLTITDGVNDTVQFTIDGTVVTIDITAGVYGSASALASEVQTRINSNEFIQAAGSSVTVTESGGTLTVTSSAYGADSTVTADSGNGLSDLMGTPVHTAGVDMVGTIGGQSGTADGLNLTAQGVTVKVNGTLTGNRGSVNYTIGHINTLDSYLDSILDSGGIIPEREESLNDQIAEINEDRQELAARLARLEESLTARFAALDQLLAGFQSTGNFLVSALSSLPTPGSSGS